VATVKDVLGASTLADGKDGEPYWCPPIRLLAGDTVRMMEHLSAFHGGAPLHDHPQSVAIPHRH
jgi:hypothetical protein